MWIPMSLSFSNFPHLTVIPLFYCLLLHVFSWPQTTLSYLLNYATQKYLISSSVFSEVFFLITLHGAWQCIMIRFLNNKYKFLNISKAPFFPIPLLLIVPLVVCQISTNFRLSPHSSWPYLQNNICVFFLLIISKHFLHRAPS